MNKLHFSKGNAKLAKDVYIFSLPSGWTCPGALDCLSKSERVTGKIKDGPDTKFRCYSASEECRFPNVRKIRWNNFNLIKDALSKKRLEVLIINSLPFDAKKIRIHSAGDFFNKSYMQSWLNVAKQFPQKLFYGYTKSIPFWIDLANQQTWPINFVLTASYGGKFDSMIKSYDLKNARVVYSYEEAKQLDLPIDHTDEFAQRLHPKSYGLLLHGVMPPNSESGKARQKLIQLGFTGYSK